MLLRSRLLVLLLALCNAPEYIVHARDMTVFLFQHQELCGNPFADAQWVPVLDACAITCKEGKEICMESDVLGQKCQELPRSCVSEWDKLFLHENDAWKTIKRPTNANKEAVDRDLRPSTAPTDFPEELKRQFGNQPFSIGFSPLI